MTTDPTAPTPPDPMAGNYRYGAGRYPLPELTAQDNPEAGQVWLTDETGATVVRIDVDELGPETALELAGRIDRMTKTEPTDP